MRSVNAIIHVIKTKARITFPIIMIGSKSIGIEVNREIMKLIELGYHGAVISIHVKPTNKKVLDRCLKNLEAIITPTMMEVTINIKLNKPFKKSIAVLKAIILIIQSILVFYFN
jgi:hypothetical protein